MSSSLLTSVWFICLIRSYAFYAQPTHSSFAWGFWWLNVVVCAYCICYWAFKRYPDGTPALVTAGGQLWIWQLVAALVIRSIDASPWHLIWLAPVSVVASIAVHRVVYNIRMNLRAGNADVVEISEALEPQGRYDANAAVPTAISRRKAAHRDASNPERLNRRSEVELLREESRSRGESEVASKAGALLESDAKRGVLYLNLGDHPAIAAKLHHYWPYVVRSNPQPTPLKVSLMFSNIAAKLVSEGEPFIALKCMECSLLFNDGGPEHWATQAEVFCALKDRSAAVYARAVLGYKEARDEAARAGLQFPHFAGHKVLPAEYKRMAEITQICKEHAEWVDTYTLSERAGLFR